MARRRTPIAGILLHTCDPLAGTTVFPLSRQEDFWKTCTVFAVIGNSRQDTNQLRFICSLRPLAYGRAKNQLLSGSVSVRSARSRWRWDLRRKVRSTLLRGI